MTSTGTPQTPTEDAAPAGSQRANITTRVTAELRLRVEQAAADCSMTVSEWVREVVESALELHEAGPPPELEGETEDEYRARVERDAANVRAALEAERTPSSTPKKFDNPRDCPHLPQWRSAGGRCSGCGGLIRLPGAAGRIGSSIGSALGLGRY